MSYYSDLKKKDIVEWMRPLLEKGIYKTRMEDGKFEVVNAAIPTHAPWHYMGFANGANCVYLQQLFNVISPRTPAGQFIPQRCQQCWKIVLRPKTLKQLFALEKFMLQLDWPRKCGIERRSYAPLSKHRYGGYIYSESQQEGGQRLIRLREALANYPGLEDVECFLKRACTEFELRYPDSTKWEVTKEQERVEKILDWLVITSLPTAQMPQHIIDRLHMTWIEWAAENGDETYLEYTDGKPLYPPPVKYEPKVEGADEDTPDDETVSVGDSSTAVPKGNTRRKMKGKKK